MKANSKHVDIIRKNDYILLSKIGSIDSGAIYSIDDAEFTKIFGVDICHDVNLLHIAAYYNSLECFRLLVEKLGVDIGSRTVNDLSVLHYACFNGSNEVADYIFCCNDNFVKDEINRDYNGSNKIILLTATAYSYSLVILKGLISAGYNGNLFDKNGKKFILPAFEHIIKNNNRNRVEFLTIMLGDFNYAEYGEKMTPLMKAIVMGQYEVVKILIQSGVDRSVITSSMETAMSKACQSGSVLCVKMLLEDNSNIDLPSKAKTEGTKFWSCAVHWGCRTTNPEIVSLLLDCDIDVNRVDSKGQSGPCLLSGCKDPQKIIDILQMLMDHGFELDRREGKAPTVLESFLVTINPPWPAIRWLIKNGASTEKKIVSARNISDQTICKYIKYLAESHSEARELVEEFHL